MSEADAGNPVGGAEEPGYTEWRCAECGHGHPKHNPPCDRCGLMKLEKTRVTAADFDDEIEPPGLVDEARERPLLTAAAAVALLAGLALVLAWPFTVSVPFTDAVYGPVAAEQPDGDGTVTAGELRHRLDDAVGTRSMNWRGRKLEVAYATAAANESALRAELTAFVEAYAAYVEGGGRAERLDVVIRVEGDPAGRVHVERSWVTDYGAEGGPSREEVLARVLATVQG